MATDPNLRDINNVAGQFTSGGLNSQQYIHANASPIRGDTFDWWGDAGDGLKAIGGFLTGIDFRTDNEFLADKQRQQNSQNQPSQSGNSGSSRSSTSDQLPSVRNRFSTSQTDAALGRNNRFTNDQTRDFLAFEEQQRRDRANDNLARQISFENLTADRSNAIANANVGRNMALNSQNTLNNVYQLAGQRLNDSARDTQSALNNAAATVASLFR